MGSRTHPSTLPEALADAGRRFGDRLAYAEGSRRVTWGELARRVDDVAAGLVSLGLQAGDRVAICGENGIDWVVAYHASVRAGCVPALVYYELRQGEIEEQVRRPACRVLFASAGVIEKLGGGIEGVEHVVEIGGPVGGPRPSTSSGRTEREASSGRTEEGPASGRAEEGPASGRAEEGPASGRTEEGPASGRTEEGEGPGETGSPHRGESRLAPTGGVGDAGVVGDAPVTHDPAVLALEAVAGLAREAALAELDGRSPSPNDTAVIVYTSGTTGGAKGVMLSHRNLLTNASAAIDALDLSGEDSSLLVLPMHHALPFLAAVVLPPLIGAGFVIENDLRRIRDRLQEFKPTIFFGVPALYELVYRNILARAEAEGRLKTLQRVQRVTGLIKRATGVNLAPLAFKSVSKALGGRLKFLVSGGAALNPQTARDFSSLGLLLLQGWGMTEASPVIAVQRYDRRKFRYSNYYEQHAGSVGPALPGVEVRLVDVPEKGIRVSETGEGEVQVRGDSVFMGYWQAPETTAEAMQDGWLRTGDLGRIDGEGNIYLTGRSKYVIVLESGEKVHPDEVETVLSQSELLQDICVVGRESPDGRNRTLVTAIVCPGVEAAQARAPELDADSLRSLVEGEVAELCKQLAAYKRVTRVELSDTPLPKTALRKVARGQLREAYEFEYETWVISGEGGGA